MKISKIVLSAVLSASLIGNVMAAESNSSSSVAPAVTSKAGDSYVTMTSKCPYVLDIGYVFRPTGAGGVDRYYPGDGRVYNIRYPDQLVCFPNLEGGPCYSSGRYDLYCGAQGTGKVEIKEASAK